jgi:hypothetical protein
MSQSVEISIAKEEDIPALCTLLELLFSQELEFSPNIEAQRKGLHSIIHNPHVGFILVGKLMVELQEWSTSCSPYQRHLENA